MTPTNIARLAFLFVLATVAHAQTQAAAIFGSRMVLQRSPATPIWGKDLPGRTVMIRGSWGDGSASAVADESGKWTVRVAIPNAGGPYRMTIEGSSTIVFDDVLVGDVWLCGGQSNMEWTVADCVKDDADRERLKSMLAECDGAKLRVFDVPNVVAVAPLSDTAGAWAKADADRAWNFSAVGYWFARHVQKDVDVPIGLVGVNWGGTVCEAWASEDALAEFPEFRASLARFAEERRSPGTFFGEYQKKIAAWFEGLGKFDPGSGQESWSAAECDESKWTDTTLPGMIGGDLAKFDGIVWYRRALDFPAGFAGRPLVLNLPPIDDMDTVWIDGKKVAESIGPDYYSVPRRYVISPEHATPGRHQLAIRVLDIAGPGGFGGTAKDMSIAVDDAAAEKVALDGAWKMRAGAKLSALPRLPNASGLHANLPAGLYNGMIAPIVPLAIKGGLFYQGEANRWDGVRYRAIFRAMIEDWRKSFAVGEFPFYWVQIAPYAYGGDVGEAALVREAQMLTMQMKNTGMAVTMDIGNPKDIHPKEKVEVGRRLALWALAKDYGKSNLVYSGPIFKTMRIESNAVRVMFDFAEGLTTRDGKTPSHFQIAGVDRKFVAAEAVIDGKTIVVSSPNCQKPVAARYAWGAADEPNLQNAAGLPASSFRTDAW